MDGLKSLHELGARIVPQYRIFVADSAERIAGSATEARGTSQNVSTEVDITLIQETLALTLQQRIQPNDRVIEEFRDDLARSRKSADDGRVDSRPRD